jgi:hypothetical protein
MAIPGVEFIPQNCGMRRNTDENNRGALKTSPALETSPATAARPVLALTAHEDRRADAVATMRKAT